MFEGILKKLGYVMKSHIDEQLNFARDVAKRLDEHREDFEFFAMQESLKGLKEWKFIVGHLATQDDYLMRLYFMVNGSFPPVAERAMSHGYVRPRPAEFGRCLLPEYEQFLERS
tara:strand:+ start:168 stop:509 length:342 start_codon:yes stop_codon:yes gene_type:complete